MDGFLTHPPSKEKPIPKEGGSVDSNGLGSLRCSKDPVNTNDLTSQVMSYYQRLLVNARILRLPTNLLAGI